MNKISAFIHPLLWQKIDERNTSFVKFRIIIQENDAYYLFKIQQNKGLRLEFEFSLRQNNITGEILLRPSRQTFFRANVEVLR